MPETINLDSATIAQLADVPGLRDELARPRRRLPRATRTIDSRAELPVNEDIDDDVLDLVRKESA